MKPKSLYKACELAQIYEARNDAKRNFVKKSVAGYSGVQPSKFTHLAKPAVVGVKAGSANRRLYDSEFEAKRVRNQCYFCEAPYTKGHNCRKKGQLMIMEIVPDEVVTTKDGANEELGVTQQLIVQTPLVDLDEPLIRLQAMWDENANSTTMQLKGVFLGKIVHVLIDSGAIHNFIHPHLLHGTKTQVQKFAPLNVMLASGAKMKTHGEVRIKLKLQDYLFSAEYYVMPVTGCEIVLGISWLKSLDNIVWNFEFMRMKFSVSNYAYQLQGETQASAAIISCKAISKLLKKEKEALLVEVHPVQSSATQSVQCQDPALLKVIDKVCRVI